MKQVMARRDCPTSVLLVKLPERPWLGIDSSNRWLIGIVAVFSFALTVQQSCDWIKECFEHSQIKNVKETTLFNIFSEKPENTIVLKKVKMLQIKKC